MQTPTFEPREIKFRGNTNSQDYNTMNKELAHDLVNIFRTVSSNEALLEDVLESMFIENRYMTQRIDELYELASELHDAGGEEVEDEDVLAYKNYINFYNKAHTSFATDLAGYAELSDYERNEVYDQYSAVTLPLDRSTSKTYLLDIDGSEIFLPDDLEIEIEPETVDEAVGTEDTNVDAAFNQDPLSAWRRVVRFETDSSVEEVTTSVRFQMPETIISNRAVNTLLIEPFPSAVLDIVGIEYKTPNASDFAELDDFETVSNARDLYFVFPDRAITEFRITFRQQHSFERDGHKNFVLGGKNIAAFRNEHRDEGRVLVRLNLQEQFGLEDRRVHRINSIEPVWTVEGDASFQPYAVEKQDGYLRAVEIGEVISENYNEDFWIEVTLHQTAQTVTPVLKGMIIDFEKLN